MIFAFNMAMGVRHSDKVLAARLDSALERTGAEIAGVLRDYSVPTLELHP
jgi:hypothetical protein